MNIMLVSVTERTKEIGLRKALGTRPKDIRNQFLAEAVTLSGLGGIVGIILGILLSLIINFRGLTVRGFLNCKFTSASRLSSLEVCNLSSPSSLALRGRGFGEAVISQFFTTVITWWSIVLSFGFPMLVGVVFGVTPAIHAARLNPIQALKYE